MTRPSDELPKLLAGIVAGHVARANFEGLEGQSGRVIVNVEICLDRGLVPWSEGAVYFRQRRKYDRG